MLFAGCELDVGDDVCVVYNDEFPWGDDEVNEYKGTVKDIIHHDDGWIRISIECNPGHCAHILDRCVIAISNFDRDLLIKI